MNTIKNLLFITTLLTNSYLFAQFSLTGSAIANDKYKIKPDIVKNIDRNEGGVASEGFTVIKHDGKQDTITVARTLNGFSGLISFQNLTLNKNYSSESFNGIPQSIKVINDKCYAIGYEKKIKGFGISEIDVLSGKTIKNYSLVNLYSNLLTCIYDDTTLISVPKYSKTDTAVKVINFKTEKVIRSYPNLGICDAKLCDDNIIFFYQPDKRIKEFNSDNTSNLCYINLNTGIVYKVRNHQFKDNKNKPKSATLFGNTMFVSYNDYKPRFIEYDLSTGNSVEWEWARLEPKDGFVDTQIANIYCVSNDGKYLVTDNGMGIQIWDIAKRIPVQFISEDLRITNGLKTPYTNVHFEGEYLVATIAGFSQIESSEKDHTSYWKFKSLIDK